MKIVRVLGAALGAALLIPASPAQAFALRLKGEEWTYGFAEKNAYFDSSANYAWLEIMLRAQATLELGDHFVIEARGAGSTTLGRDYYADDNEDAAPYLKPFRYEGRVDLLSFNFERLLQGKLNIKVGRQEISYGEGFLIADGYNEYGALTYRQALAAQKQADSAYGGTGQWIIPFKSWDAARASLDLEPVSIDLMVARLDASTLPDPTDPPATFFPGFLAAADVGWKGEVFSVGATGLSRTVFGEGVEAGSPNGKYRLDALAVRAAAAPDDWSIQAEVVGQLGHGGGDLPDRQAIGGRFNIKHTWGMNPFSPWVRASAYYFSGDDPNTPVDESYDPLYYDWIDFGRWYFGNISSSQWFENSDQVVGELGVGFQPTPLQNVKLLFYGIASQTGTYGCSVLECEDESGSVGAFKPLVAEANLVWDWAPSEVGKWKPDGKFYFGAETAVAVPLGPFRELAGTSPAMELMLFSTINF